MAQNLIDDYNLVTGPQKAAILMLSLEEDKASKIFSLMDEEEIKEISVVMASLGKVSSNVVEQLFIEFGERTSSTGSLVGSYESTERLLLKNLDKERVANIMEEIRDDNKSLRDWGNNNYNEKEELENEVDKLKDDVSDLKKELEDLKNEYKEMEDVVYYLKQDKEELEKIIEYNKSLNY